MNNAIVGEVYVLNDGGEVDLDLGNYERYLDVTLSRDNNITTGKIYQQVIEREVCCIDIAFSRKMKLCIATRGLSRANSAGKPVQPVLIMLDKTIICKIVPHVTDAIQDWIERVSKIPVDETGEEPDLCIVEVCSLLSSHMPFYSVKW